KIFLYSMHCYSSSLFRLLGYNDIVGLDGYANVAAAAFSATAWQLEDLRAVSTLALAEGVAAHLFEGTGRSVAALIPSPAGHAPLTLRSSRELEVSDLFGNPLADGAPLGLTVVYVASRKPAAQLEKTLRQMSR
ncbi:MAG: hypothetical protein KKI08_05315, partial [Armatimonadetes bacterium]|nr:hypothetical protein [Armatimonadota bacterium]